MANIFNRQLLFLVLVFVAVVEGDTLTNMTNTSNVNCTDRDTFILHRTFVEDFAIFDLTETIQCEENMTMVLSKNSLPDESKETGSATNKSQAPNQTSQQASSNIPDWYVLFQQVDFATRGIISPIATLLAFIGNTLFIIVLCKGYVQSNSYVYLLGLACSNLGTTILYSPFFAGAHKSIKVLRSYQTLYAFYFSYALPLGVIVQTSGVWVILLFTLERFVAVTFPMQAKRYSSIKRFRFAVFLAYMVGVTLNFVRFFRRKVIRKIDPVTGEHYYSYTLTKFGQNKTNDALTFWPYVVFNDVIPFLLLLFFNTMIIHRVWKARFTRVKMAGKQNVEEDKNSSREHQITRLLVAIVFGFLTSNSLSCVASMFAAINSYGTLFVTYTPSVYYIYLIGTVLNRAGPLINCILYAVCNDAMRNGVISVIICRNPEKNGKLARSNTETTGTAFSQ